MDAQATVSPPSGIKYLGRNLWIIKFCNEHIETTGTSRASDVDHWIIRTITIHRFRRDEPFVGLDTEWCLPTKINKRQKVAILQLCVGCRCLIFKLCHKDKIPQSLIDFFGNKKLTFVGKGIQTDANKLFEDYKLNVGRLMDVSDIAALKYDDEELSRMGLKRLVLRVLNVEMEKSKSITLSKWARNKLSNEQIQYAAIDAVVSFKLATKFVVERNESGAAAVH